MDNIKLYRPSNIVGGWDAFYLATVNGIVRLDVTTSAKIEGLCTHNLKVCFALILQCPSLSKTSLSHLLTLVTDIEKLVDGEIDWFGVNNVDKIFATIVMNEYHLIQNPTHMQNCIRYLEELQNKLNLSGITKINHLTSKNGLVVYRRASGEIFVPESPSTFVEHTWIGKACPHFNLRSAIPALPYLGRIAADLQFDGNYWINNKHEQGIFSNAKLLEFWKYEGSIDKLVAVLRANSDLLRIRSIPGNIKSEDEWEQYLGIVADRIVVYLNTKKEYDVCVRNYKMFTMTAEQISLVELIGGKVLDEKDRGMYQVMLPSKFLLEPVRKVLSMDRLRVKMNQFSLLGRLMMGIKGWRGEPDFEEPLSWSLITFPFHDEADRQSKRRILQSVIV